MVSRTTNQQTKKEASGHMEGSGKTTTRTRSQNQSNLGQLDIHHHQEEK